METQIGVNRSYYIVIKQLENNKPTGEERGVEFDFDTPEDFDRDLSVAFADCEMEVHDMEREAQQSEIRELNKAKLARLANYVIPLLNRSSLRVRGLPLEIDDVEFSSDMQSLCFVAGTPEGEVEFKLNLEEPEEV